ncbi:MAG TPA: hypothetical protein VIX80_09510 [Candidatus Kapabacteria bacterium]
MLIVYRRIIEPFFEGLRGVRKPYNEPQGRSSIKKEPRHGLPKDKEIQDAEFTEIK